MITEPVPTVSPEYNLSNQRVTFEALEAERCRLGMTVFDMEAKSGVSLNSVYAWRTCKRSPMLVNMVALAETFGFEVVMRRKEIAE